MRYCIMTNFFICLVVKFGWPLKFSIFFHVAPTTTALSLGGQGGHIEKNCPEQCSSISGMGITTGTWGGTCWTLGHLSPGRDITDNSRRLCLTSRAPVYAFLLFCSQISTCFHLDLLIGVCHIHLASHSRRSWQWNHQLFTRQTFITNAVTSDHSKDHLEINVLSGSLDVKCVEFKELCYLQQQVEDPL